MHDSATKPAPTIYVMQKNQMTGWIYSISQIGTWDLETGKAIPSNGNANCPALSDDMLQCKPMPAPSQLNCDGHIFDLRPGKVNGAAVFVGALRTYQERQIDGVAFQGNQLIVLQMAQIDQTQEFYLLRCNLFQSSFNQLFDLGRADSALSEMVYTDYPYARIFRLQTQKCGPNKLKT